MKAFLIEPELLNNLEVKECFEIFLIRPLPENILEELNYTMRTDRCHLPNEIIALGIEN